MIPKKCSCKVCYPVCVFEVSYKVPYSICKQCHRGNHKKKVE